MKNNLLLTFMLMIFSLTVGAQTPKGKQHIAICEQGKGCDIFAIKTSPEAIDKAFNKPNFWINASDSATLIIENCTQKIDEKQSLVAIHQSFGGKGEPKKISNFDIQKYLQQKGRFYCPNTTKKMSFFYKRKWRRCDVWEWLFLPEPQSWRGLYAQ